jgi:hypothetical protein
MYLVDAKASGGRAVCVVRSTWATMAAPASFKSINERRVKAFKPKFPVCAITFLGICQSTSLHTT